MARNKFADLAEPTLEDFTPFTVAWCIQRVIEDVRANSASMRQHGESQVVILRVLQRMPIGHKDARKLSRQDIIEHAKRRRSTPSAPGRKPVSGPTVIHDIGCLAGVLDHCNATWEDCAEISRAPIEAARPYLVKHQLVSKSIPRKQRPTEQQILALKAYAINMCLYGKNRGRSIADRIPDIIDAARISARRLGEICRITHGDVDYENMTYWVRDLKHPTKKKGNDKQFFLWPELAAIFKRQPRLTNDPGERIFAVHAKSISAWYTKAKKPGAATPEGIFNLRFHDNRRDATSRALIKLKSKDLVRKLVTGHESDKQIDQTYDGRDMEELKSMIPAQLRDGLESMLAPVTRQQVAAFSQAAR